MTAQVTAFPGGSEVVTSGTVITALSGVAYQIADVGPDGSVGPALTPPELQLLVNEPDLGDITAVLPDGTQVVFKGMVELFGQGTGIAGADGTLVVASLEDAVATAAGGDGGGTAPDGGGSSAAFNTATISELTNFEGGPGGSFNAGGVDLSALGDADPNLILTILAAGGLLPPTLSVGPAIGLEDSPSALGIFLNIVVGPSPTPGATTVIQINGIPAGATLFNDAGPIVTNPGPDPLSVNGLSVAQLSGIGITPPTDSDADFDIVVIARAILGNLIATVSETETVVVKAVADLAEITFNGLTAAASPVGTVKNPVQTELEGQGDSGANDTAGTAQDLGTLSAPTADNPNPVIAVDGWIDVDDLNDADVYKVIVTEAGAYKFDVDFGDSQSALGLNGRFDHADLQLFLFDAAGNVLGEDDDTDGLDPEIVANLQAGTYFIAVTAFDNDPVGGNLNNGFTGGHTLQSRSGDYRLLVQLDGADNITGDMFSTTVLEDKAQDVGGMFVDGATVAARTQSADIDIAVTDVDGSESITRVDIAVDTAPPGLQFDLNGDGTFDAAGATVTLNVTRFGAGAGTLNVNLQTEPNTGALFFVIDPGERVQTIDLSSFSWVVDQHNDQDFTISLQVRTTETNPTEGTTLDPTQVAVPHAYQTTSIMVNTRAVADKPTLSLTQALLLEDNATATGPMNMFVDGTPIYLLGPATAAVTDTDGSESLTEVQLNSAAVTAAGGELTFNGTPVSTLLGGQNGTLDIAVQTVTGPATVTAQVSLTGQGITIQFDPADRVQSVQLDTQFGIQLPQHLDGQFQITVVATATETNPSEGTTADPTQVAVQSQTQTANTNLSILAVADKASVTVANVEVNEDNATLAMGMYTDGTPTYGIPISAAVVDTDGSESITEIRIDGDTLPAGAEFEFGGGPFVAFATATTATGTGPVQAEATLVGNDLVLTFDPALRIQSIDISGSELSVVFPQHLDGIYSIETQVTTTETNPNNAALPAGATAVQTTSFDLLVGAVADKATVTAANVTANEDNATLAAGMYTDGTPAFPINVVAGVTDQDGSESIVQIVLTSTEVQTAGGQLTFQDSSTDGTFDVLVTRLDADGNQVTETVSADVAFTASGVTLTFADGLRVQSIDNSQFDAVLPQHKDGVFQVDWSVTTRETNENAPGNTVSNDATITGSLSLTVGAVADTAQVTSILVSYNEDNAVETPASSGMYVDGTPTYGIPISAAVADTDGSESITEIRIDGGTLPNGVAFDVSAGFVAFATATTATGVGPVQAEATFDGSALVLTFDPNLRVQSVDISATELTVTFPQHLNGSISFQIQVTTTETNEMAPANTVSDTAVRTGTVGIDVFAVADKASVTVANVGANEDNATLANNMYTDGTPTYGTPISAAVVDTDGSESITEIRIDGDTLPDGAKFNIANGATVDFATATTATGTGPVQATASLDGKDLVLTFAPGVRLQTIDISGTELSVTFPQHMDGVYTIETQVTTTETLPNGPGIAVPTAVQTASFNFTVGAIADKATVTAANVNANEDNATQAAGMYVDNSQIYNLPFVASVTDTDGSESITQVVLTSTAVQTAGGLFLFNDANVDGSVFVEVGALDANGNAVTVLAPATIAFTASGVTLTFTEDTRVQSIDTSKLQVLLPQHKDGVFQVDWSVTTKETNENAPTSTVLDETTVTGSLNLTVGAVADKATITANTVTVNEDNAVESPASSGMYEDGLSEFGLVFSAAVADTDGSESITEIRIDGDSLPPGAIFNVTGGGFVLLANATTATGTGPIQVEANFVGKDVVLTFPPSPSVQSISISGDDLPVSWPIHLHGSFDIEIQVKTTETNEMSPANTVSDTATQTATLTLNVQAVADKPVFANVPTMVMGTPSQGLSLAGTVTTPDIDGSEGLSQLKISGLLGDPNLGGSTISFTDAAGATVTITDGDLASGDNSATVDGIITIDLTQYQGVTLAGITIGANGTKVVGVDTSANGINLIVFTPAGIIESGTITLEATSTETAAPIAVASQSQTASIAFTVKPEIVTAFDSESITEDSNASGNSFVVGTSVIANDTDNNPGPTDPMTISGIAFGGIAGGVGSPISGAFGSLTINTDGTYTYTLDDESPTDQTVDALNVGQSLTETFTYTVSDGANSETGSLVITINGVNDAPVATDDSFTTDWDTVLVDAETVGNVITNTNPNGADSDVDGGTLSVTGISMLGTDFTGTDVSVTSFTETSPGVGTLVTAGGTMTVTVAADGTVGLSRVSGDPFGALGAGESGSLDFTYTLSDGQGGTSTATATINFTGANDNPVANSDEFSTDEDAVEAGLVSLGNVIVNTDPFGTDSDIDGDTLSITSISDLSTIFAGTAVSVTNIGAVSAGAPFTATLTTATGMADLTVASNGDVSLTGTSGDPFGSLTRSESGLIRFAYTLSDGQGGTDTATVTITINGVNEAPIATDDSFNISEDSVVPASATVGNVITNTSPNGADSDQDGDPLTVTGFSNLNFNFAGTGVTGLAFGTSGLFATDDGSAILSVAADGTVTIDTIVGDPFGALSSTESGTISFDYTLSDGQGGTNIATTTITVNGTNDPPVALPVNLFSYGGTPFSVSLPASDSETSNLAFELTITGDPYSLTDPTGPVLSITPPAFVQQPGQDPVNTYNGSYKVTDGEGTMAAASFTGNVLDATLDLVGGNDANVVDVIVDNSGSGKTVTGNAGIDFLYGLDGNDVLLGGLGDDSLFGGSGTDTMTGGTGADAFVFNLGDLQNVINLADVITDFQDNIDTIVLNLNGGALGGGIVTSEQTVAGVGTAATDTVISVQGSGEIIAVLQDVSGITIDDTDLVINS